MRLLLDTSILLRWVGSAGGVLPRMRDLIESESNSIAYSPLSLWECRINEAKGRLPLPKDFLAVIRSKDFVELGFAADHANEVGLLPAIHSDPFDRGLVAQARFEELTILTEDRILAQHEVRIQMV